MKWAIVSLLGFQYLLNLLHSYRICHLVLIGYKLHGYKKSSLEKNLRWYLLMEAWLIIVLVALVHKEFKWPNCCNQELSLITNGSIELRSVSNNSKKIFFEIYHLEGYFLLREDRITFLLFTKIPWWFVWKNRNWVETLGIFVY